MTRSSKRGRNKKSRAELLAHLNQDARGFPQDVRLSSQSVQRPLWRRLLVYLVEFATMYVVIIVCTNKALKSLDLFPRHQQKQQQHTMQESNENVVLNDMKDSSTQHDHDRSAVIEKSATVEIAAVGENGSVDPNNNLIPPAIIESSIIEVQVSSPQNIDSSPTKNTKGTISSIVDYVTNTMIQQPQLDIAFTSPLDDYPQVLNITPELYKDFHPVIKFPIKTVLEPVEQQKGKSHYGQHSKPKMKKRKKQMYHVLDFTSASGSVQLILPQDQEQFRRERKKKIPIFSLFGGGKKDGNDEESQYGIGRYDENRVNLYSSPMFQNEDNQIDGYDGLRTVHMGIDLGGPIGTNVYSFWNGSVHSVGYNHELGDYGYVIVIKYELPTKSPSLSLHQSNDGKDDSQTVWALYGHLDKSVMKNKVDQRIKKGQVIGRIGDVHENGGWKTPHVHFQLSMIEPETHDMPGAVSVKDRTKAILDYPDPRHILGSLY